MTSEYPGLFVVFEGGEGSGKTKQSNKLASVLELEGLPHLLTHEPGDTELGKELRRLLLSKDSRPLTQKAEALLFAADRAEHVETVIKPALHQGNIVICDRYIASTVAYQAYAGGLPVDKINDLSAWASSWLKPDVTFLLDIEPDIGIQRTLLRGKPNRFDEATIDYHERVRQGFLEQVDDGWVVIDALEHAVLIHTNVIAHVKAMYSQKMARFQHASQSGDKVKILFCPQCHAALIDDAGKYVCPNGHGFMQFQRRITNAHDHP